MAEWFKASDLSTDRYFAEDAS